jgi:hypothetical protein
VKVVAGIAAGPAAAAPQSINTGSLIGAAIGGGLLVVGIIGVAIRFKIVSAQLNGTPKVSSWRTKGKKNRMPEFEIGTNPVPGPVLTQNPALSLRKERISMTPTPIASAV